jgi:hypothetical protein
MVGGAKWNFYQNHTKASGITTVNKKNLVVVARFGGGLKESYCGLGGARYASKGNDGA